MLKFKDAFLKAKIRRMNETGCSLIDAVDWVNEQNMGFLIDYVNETVEEEKSWPLNGDTYYSIGSDHSGAVIHNYMYTNDCIDKNLQIMNNFFRTEEDAAFEYERLKILHELKELSDDDQPWNGSKPHYSITYDCGAEHISIRERFYYKSANEIYFKSYHSAENAVITIGKDKIKKYLFGLK